PPSCADLLTLSLHDALPISSRRDRAGNDATDPRDVGDPLARVGNGDVAGRGADDLDEGPDPDAGPHGAVMGVKRAHRDGNPDRRSEEHTSELQSRENLVCRL